VKVAGKLDNLRPVHSLLDDLNRLGSYLRNCSGCFGQAGIGSGFPTSVRRMTLSARVGENFARQRGKTEGVIKFSVCKQPTSRLGADFEIKPLTRAGEFCQSVKRARMLSDAKVLWNFATKRGRARGKVSAKVSAPREGGIE
jgi:hypothetical protein